MTKLVCITTDYQFCKGDYFCHCKPCGKERYARDLVEWRQKWNLAKASEDYAMLDILDRAFEMIGMP